MNKRFTHQLFLPVIAGMFFWGNANAQNQVANSGFENWETVYTSGQTVEQEPVNWSSFRTNAGSYATLARAKQVDASSVIRPGSKGTKSAVIWARNVAIAIANGNLTTGQIQAGNMTPSNIANHNKTIRSNPDHNMPFTARPDSLTIWAKYRPGNKSHEARIAAVIHGDNDYQDPNNSATIESFVIGKAILNYSATNDNGWQRLSIPFDYESFPENENNKEPKYILISITTNKTPGVGSTGASTTDSVYVDDMLMIYKPSLKAENTSGKSVFAPADVLNVTYTLTGTMSPDNLNADANVVSLELSDALGSFSAPTVLDYAVTNESGVFTVKLPEDLEIGDGYKVRIVTTNYPMTSNELDISVLIPATITTTAANNDDLGCNPTVTPPEFTVTDNCNESAEATVTTDGPTKTACNYSQTWTANYTSKCGTATPVSITYRWVQNAPAEITTNATDNDDLGANPTTVTPPEFTVTDECNASAAATVTTDGPTNIGENYSQTWTANYTPECGSAATPVSITYRWVQNDDSSVKKIAVENTIFIYPNPVSKTLFVECAEAEKAAVYTLNGLKIAEVKITENGIDVSDYAKGLYLIAIEAKDGSVYRTLFVKE